jgi:iron-sulfur cluster repair protein YtfE (RIC family)
MRPALPTECLFMLPHYPRHRWLSSDLHPTAARWLQAHGWFRTTLDTLIGLRQDAFGVGALQQVHTFISILDAHHNGESHLYFPLLSAADARIAHAIQVLESDHRQIDAELAEIATQLPDTTATWRAARRIQTTLLFDRLAQLQAPLLRHLADEEDLVIPFLSLRGDPVTGERSRRLTSAASAPEMGKL